MFIARHRGTTLSGRAGLTGHRPFDATSLPGLMKAHLMAEPPRPSQERHDIPPELDTVIARGMAKNPADRYQRIDDLAAAAQAALYRWGPTSSRSVAPPEAPRATAVLDTSTPRRRTRLAALIACGVVLAAVCGFGGYAIGRTSTDAVALPETTTRPTVTTSVAAPSPTMNSQPPTFAAPAAPLTLGPSSPSGRSAKYVYRVESNYPVVLSYVGANGDLQSASSVPTPWTSAVDTTDWGTDARPLISVMSTSAKGDTKVSCAIIDDQGREVASQERASAFAGASCAVYS